jgi:hypothetical protein
MRGISIALLIAACHGATTGSTGDGAAGDDGANAGDATTVPIDPPASMTSDARIITANGTAFVIDDVGPALEQVLGTGGVDNVIFYVHGRSCGGGGEPAKSLAESMPALEADYTARALMFTWPGSSNGCPLGFPETEARASGLALAHVLHELAYYAYTHPDRLANVKLTLITHSMGNLVLEAAAEQDSTPLPPHLLDTVVLNSSATALAAHASWLAHVTFAPAVYVTENAGDNVLAAAAVGRGTRLGQKLDGEPLAATASYVDFTASNVNHAYYIHSGMHGAHMQAFYDTVMNGLAFDFATAAGIANVEARSGTHIYTFDGQ